MIRTVSNVHFHKPGMAFAMALLAGVLAGCASQTPRLPEPLRGPKQAAEQQEVLKESSADGRTRPRVEEGPSTGRASTAQQASVETRVPTIPGKKPVALVMDGVPLAAFINVLFGTELGFALEIEQSVRARMDLVSLRLTEPTSPEKAYSVGVEVLKNYGVQVQELGGVLRFFPTPTAGYGTPQIVAARSRAEVPASQRPVFVAMPLEASTPGQITAIVRNVFGTQSSVTLTELPEAGAVLIGGPPDAVQAAMEAIEALDRASLRNKQSLRINPLYLSAEVLARELRDVLSGQGYSVRTGQGTEGVVTFIPVASANALIVFSESEPAMQAVREWTERLDQPSDENAGDGGVYIYSARYTTVESLLPVLEALIGGKASSSASRASPSGAGTQQQASQGGDLGAPPQGSARNSNSGASSGSKGVSVIGGVDQQLAVDPIRNVIVFQGDAQRWRAIQGVLVRLDQPARQVVIEVTVAEVTLTDEFSHGIEWALRNIGVNGVSGPVTALKGDGKGGGGLVWRALSSSGQVSALVNLFGKDSRVQILSTPRLMVKSGEHASIDVGTEVPIITQQATAADLPQNGNSASILQQVQYRKTGVLLDLDAVVHSGQRVDLKLSQEVSEAAPTDSSDISSPSIFSRKLTTSLSLQDGESMLLGGLISSSRSDTKTKVPLLGDIPAVGRLFQNRNRTGVRTEMLMLITPYVVEDASQARAITDAIRNRFGNETRSRWSKLMDRSAASQPQAGQAPAATGAAADAPATTAAPASTADVDIPSATGSAPAESQPSQAGQAAPAGAVNSPVVQPSADKGREGAPVPQGKQESPPQPVPDNSESRRKPEA